MDWFNMLKMPNPFGGKWEDLTREEYNKLDNKDKGRYHENSWKRFQKQRKALVAPRKAGQAPPATDNQIRELRELERFYSRQYHRLQRGYGKETFYSPEEENNRREILPHFDAVERRNITTKEMYDDYTREEKYRYWARINNRREVTSFKEKETLKLAGRMIHRMKINPNYTPPFEGDEAAAEGYMDEYVHRDVSEYDNFTDEEKFRYHARQTSRLKSEGRDSDLMRFHSRMAGRLRKNRNKGLPTYPTPEAQKEAEQ